MKINGRMWGNQNQRKVMERNRRGEVSMGLSQVKETKSCDFV